MNEYGLIGKPLAHSFSVDYFGRKFLREKLDARYAAYELESIDCFPLLVGEMRFSGLNVTSPYKEQVLDYVDELDPIAKQIGAINVIDFRDGVSIGYNTDYIGFMKSVEPLIGDNKKALILGTGGAAKAVKFAFEQLGVCCLQVSRTRNSGAIQYSDLDKEMMHTYPLIVNCTPLGMASLANECPAIPYEYLTSGNVLYDLIYNPSKTLFLKLGEEYGARIMNGFQMLSIQAEESWRIWSRK